METGLLMNLALALTSLNMVVMSIFNLFRIFDNEEGATGQFIGSLTGAIIVGFAAYHGSF